MRNLITGASYPLPAVWYNAKFAVPGGHSGCHCDFICPREPLMNSELLNECLDLFKESIDYSLKQNMTEMIA